MTLSIQYPTRARVGVLVEGVDLLVCFFLFLLASSQYSAQTLLVNGTNMSWLVVAAGRATWFVLSLHSLLIPYKTNLNISGGEGGEMNRLLVIIYFVMQSLIYFSFSRWCLSYSIPARLLNPLHIYCLGPADYSLTWHFLKSYLSSVIQSLKRVPIKSRVTRKINMHIHMEHNIHASCGCGCFYSLEWVLCSLWLIFLMNMDMNTRNKKRSSTS
jgi:hypothetical protein